MTALRTLAQVWVALTYLVVLAINGWQAINSVNMPWSAVVTLFMLISFFFTSVFVGTLIIEIKKDDQP